VVERLVSVTPSAAPRAAVHDQHWSPGGVSSNLPIHLVACTDIEQPTKVRTRFRQYLDHR
jgi:hypothetical protein